MPPPKPRLRPLRHVLLGPALLALLALLTLLGCQGGGGGGQGPAPVVTPAGTPVPAPVPVPPAPMDFEDGTQFEVKPYLQLGDAPDRPDRLSLLWHAAEGKDGWEVEVRTAPAGAWLRMAPPTSNPVAIPATRVAAQRVWTAILAPLVPGGTFDYRILRGDRVVFQQAGARARKGPGQPQRVVFAGDLVEPANPSAWAIARRIHAQNADLMLALGDLTYQDGTYREYREGFFPAYNASPTNTSGAPFMRTTLMVGVLGNHDVNHVDRVARPRPSSLAYYYCWDQPRNGPDLRPGGHVANLTPASAWAPFLAAAGDRYPAMGNFHFDSGPARFVVLDSNRYVHWDDTNLRAWLARTLDQTPAGHWRIVAFHHPGFNPTGYDHTGDWQMRQLWPLFERHGVDVVLNGHLHAYARSRPFRTGTSPTGLPDSVHCANEANITSDTRFDGTRTTRAAGPIQIITGAAGGISHAHLGTPAVPPKPFHQTLVADRHSFSIMDMELGRILFRQLDENGGELDRFTLTK